MMRRLSGVSLAALAVTLAVAPLVSAKPPDLPNNPTIVVTPEPEEPAMSLQTILTSWLFLGVHPIMTFDTKDQSATDPAAALEEFERTSLPKFEWMESNPLKEQVVCSTGFSTGRIVVLKAGEATEEESAQQTPPEKGCSGCCFCRFMQANWYWCLGPECCCCGALNQFGMCWMSWVADCWKHSLAEGEKAEDYVIQLEPPGIQNEKMDTAYLEKRIREEVHGRLEPACSANSCGAVERLLQSPISVCFTGTPLSKVFEAFQTAAGVPIVIDQVSLTKAGVGSLDELSVTFHVMNTPLGVALNLLLQPYRLTAEVNGCVVSISAKPREEEAPKPEACESACPKCEEMHAKYVATRAQVNRLMKACYLAVGEGRFDQAARLARKAHKLDPARVEGDPLIYKMQLLSPKKPKHCSGSMEEPVKEEDPPLSMRPPLPEIHLGDVVPAMDAVLTGADEMPPAQSAPQPPE